MKAAQNPKVASPKKSVKARKPVIVKFDKEGLMLAWGLAIATGGIGYLIIWATKTAPADAKESVGVTAAQRAAHLLPQSSKETMAFIVGSLFILFAVFCVFLGLKLIYKYLNAKNTN